MGMGMGMGMGMDSLGAKKRRRSADLRASSTESRCTLGGIGDGRMDGQERGDGK